MKSLTEYIQDKQTALFKEMGVFFAFSNEQFAKSKTPIKKGSKYVSFGSGGYLPSYNLDEFIEKHEKIVTSGIAQDIKENGIEGIIKRELANYECFYTGDIEDCVDALKRYDITAEQILEVYKIAKQEVNYD